MNRVALFLLGPPRIERGGEPVEIDTRKAIALAAYLAVSGEDHTRDELATVFWPLSDQTRARAALRRTLSTLRRAFDEEQLEVDGDYLALRPGGDFRVDVDQFLSLLAQCETHGHPPEGVCPACVTPLRQAVELYRADFMTGFTLRDSPGFDQWQTFQTESLRLELAYALERLVRFHRDRREFEPAIAYARRWIALDPLHELPHYLLMQMYTWVGQRSAALRQYQEYVQVLQEELGVSPEEEIAQLYQRLRENQELPLPLRVVPTPVHNLPLQPTPFVGREEELEEIAALLDRETCRMLTLSGPGGIGKTRLALQLAGQRVGEFAHGVYFVPLAQMQSADLLVPAIADAIGFSFHGRTDPKKQLLNYLSEKQVLLLLDNFEHLAARDGTGFLVELLSHVPGVKLLVTSRERLNLQWEWPFEVRGLQFPKDGKDGLPETYSAIQLFLQTARRAHPGFALAEADKPFVVRICRSLDGMPLGIELAAAWVEVSSCHQIAHEIERNLDFLSTIRRDVPERHRSLQAAFEHSWELLSPEEQTILIKLSVFRNGFPLEGAVYVAGASLLFLSALMHKSFLRRGATGRFEMLEVLRQYAEERLQEIGQMWEETRDRHCEYYTEFLCECEDVLTGAKPQQILDDISEEIDNVRAAWQWAIRMRNREHIEKSLESLQRFFDMRSWFAEAEELFGQAAQALAADGDPESDALLAKVLTRQGLFLRKLSRFEQGRELLETSLATFRRLGVQEGTALALNCLGIDTALQGNLDQAAQLLEESIAISDAIGDPIGMASSLNNIGIVAIMLQRYKEAKLILQESLTIRAKQGHLKGMLDSLTNLGHVAEALGDYVEAKEYHQKCLGICIEIGDRWGMANSLCSLGFTLTALRQNVAAQRCFQESLEIGVDLQYVDLILESLVGIATTLAEEGDEERALELVACVLHHRAAAGQAKERAEQLLAELETRLAPLVFKSARERGKAQDLLHYARVFGVRVMMV